MLGLEIELFTLDNSGNMVNSADKLIKKVNEKNKDIILKEECAKNMVELCSFPSLNVHDSMADILKNLEALLICAEKMDITIFPLGTYPGKFTPKMRKTSGYKIKEGLFGKKRFEIAGRCIGFHCHYALPWGVFDQKNLTIKELINSKNKQSLVNSYNLLIAMDPVLTTFMQSSPFYQGKFFGKDSRVIQYRGGKNLRFPDGLYSNYPAFGGLQTYKHTGTDLLNYISNKYVIWRNKLRKVGFNIQTLSKYGSILETTWNPVKVNANGTLEQRGMDVNMPLLILSASTMIKYILKNVQQEFIKVVPSDIGIKEPFKFEKNTLYISPDSNVRTKLQRASAYKGLDSDIIYNYSKRLLKLAKSLVTKKERKFLGPFENMIKERKTVSDGIILEAKKKGYSKGAELPQKVAAEIALNHSHKLFKDILLTKKLVEDIK